MQRAKELDTDLIFLAVWTAKERVKAVFETIAGKCRVEEACQRLGISEQRFRQLREEILAGSAGRRRAGQTGTPAKIVTPADEENRALQEQLAAKDVELRAAQARAEIALTLPQVVINPASRSRGEHGVAEPQAGKKTRRPAAPNGRRPPGTRKNT